MSFLLDSTPLPKPLSDFQLIDMRPALRPHDVFLVEIGHVSADQVNRVVAGYQPSEETMVEQSQNADGSWTIRAFTEPRRTEIERAATRLQLWLEEHVARGA